MKVIDIEDVQGTERDVACPRGGFKSLRYLLAKDGMGFSLHRTEIPKGTPQHWHYKHHKEACYCIAGRGILNNLTTKQWFVIEPGTCYVLDNHDDHTFQALEDTVLISVFNPPVTGSEVHDADGSYSLGESARAFGMVPA
jgi:L-ectoine synthase